MTDRDWAFLTDPDYGDPLADIKDWMLRPYSEKDKEKHREVDVDTKGEGDGNTVAIQPEPAKPTPASEHVKGDMVPDSITINGVIISRKQYELSAGYQWTWEAFVAANHPEHYDGEPCELPVWSGDKKLAKGIRFEYTGRKTSSYTINNWSAVNGKIMWGPHTAVLWELRAVRIEPEHVNGERCTAPVLRGENTDGIDHFIFDEMVNCVEEGQWFLADTGQIWRANGMYPTPHWTLAAVSKQPAPKYDVGQWVVPLDWKPRQIDRVDWDGHDYFYHVPDGPGFTDASLRPATREDFMMEFGGVKVWMEKHDGTTKVCWDWGPEVGEELLYSFQITIYKTAGVMDMPEEFWEEK
jgi:hypothetical protein